MLAVSKLWELKNGKLPSYKLGDVGEEVVGETKLSCLTATTHGHGQGTIHTLLPTGRGFYRLDEAVNALDYFIALQHLVQCDATFYPFHHQDVHKPSVDRPRL